VSEYDVGYGKPPKHSQFKKGSCPNPRDSTTHVIQLLDIAWRIQYHQWASPYGTAMNPWCDSIFGFLLMSCETAPKIHGDGNWSLFMLALVALILAWYFFVRFLSND
jgi:hypothetical protein